MNREESRLQVKKCIDFRGLIWISTSEKFMEVKYYDNERSYREAASESGTFSGI